MEEGGVAAGDDVVPGETGGPAQPELSSPDTGRHSTRQEGGTGLQPGGGPNIILASQFY